MSNTLSRCTTLSVKLTVDVRTSEGISRANEVFRVLFQLLEALIKRKRVRLSKDFVDTCFRSLQLVIFEIRGTSAKGYQSDRTWCEFHGNEEHRCFCPLQLCSCPPTA